MRTDLPSAEEEAARSSSSKVPANQIAELAEAMNNLAKALADLNTYLNSNPDIATMPAVIKDLNQKLRTLSSRL